MIHTKCFGTAPVQSLSCNIFRHVFEIRILPGSLSVNSKLLSPTDTHVSTVIDLQQLTPWELSVVRRLLKEYLYFQVNNLCLSGSLPLDTKGNNLNCNCVVAIG